MYKLGVHYSCKLSRHRNYSGPSLVPRPLRPTPRGMRLYCKQSEAVQELGNKAMIVMAIA